eukprot:6635678-Heterocapsa_arctica.AAC.1
MRGTVKVLNITWGIVPNPRLNRTTWSRNGWLGGRRCITAGTKSERMENTLRAPKGSAVQHDSCPVG